MLSNILFVVVICLFVWLMWYLSKPWDEQTDRDAERNTQILKDEYERRKMDRDLALTRAFYEKKGKE